MAAIHPNPVWAPAFSPHVERVVWSPIPANGTIVQTPAGPGRLVNSVFDKSAVLLDTGALQICEPSQVTIVCPAPKAVDSRKRNLSSESSDPMSPRRRCLDS